jgi:hypothetical protein
VAQITYRVNREPQRWRKGPPGTHFLASDAASFITGAILDINGGRFLRS